MLTKNLLKKTEEELEALKEELERQDIMTILRGCGDGIVCENIKDVRAFSVLVKWTGIVKAVIVDEACPNYNELRDEAKRCQYEVSSKVPITHSQNKL